MNENPLEKLIRLASTRNVSAYVRRNEAEKISFVEAYKAPLDKDALRAKFLSELPDRLKKLEGEQVALKTGEGTIIGTVVRVDEGAVVIELDLTRKSDYPTPSTQKRVTVSFRDITKLIA